MILVLVEHDQKKVRPATLHCVGAASALRLPIYLLVAGFHCDSVVEQCQKIEGVEGIFQADHACYQHGLAEPLAQLIHHCCEQEDVCYVMAAHTSYGKNVLPRVAALQDVGQISDVVAIESSDVFKRPIYAGNAIATIQSLDSLKVLTIRATAFEKARSDALCQAFVKKLAYASNHVLSQWVKQTTPNTESPPLSSAKIIVSGGRGLKSKENFTRVEKLASRLKAAVGASRAAVDSGWASNDLQVGQTGQIVAPDLYIALGISGAIQHLAGIKDSKVIVAINQDAKAPIFQVADYGLVADLFDVLSKLDNLFSMLGENE